MASNSKKEARSTNNFAFKTRSRIKLLNLILSLFLLLFSYPN